MNNKSGFTIIELIITTVIMAVVCVIAPVIISKRVHIEKSKKFNFISKCANPDAKMKKENASSHTEDNKTYKCIFDSITTTTKFQKTKEGKVINPVTSFDYNKNSNEFYTIELIGGGGSGSSYSVGYPGEFKIVRLPSLGKNDVITNPKFKEEASRNTTNKKKFEGLYKGILTGYYLLEAGAGGEAGYSGEPSRICIISELEANGSIDSISCDDEGRIIIAEAAGGISSSESNDNENDRLEQYGIYDGHRESQHYGEGGIKGDDKKLTNGYRGMIIIK